MKLHQLRYALEVVEQDFNVSNAANALFTSQPGVSKQIRLLESELGVPIFVRDGNRLTGLTLPGEKMMQRAKNVFREISNIKMIGDQYSQEDIGSLTIATTHTQARYALPEVIKEFLKNYPKVNLIIKQGYPEEIASHVSEGEADIVIATEAITKRSDLIALPCYQWNRCLLVKSNHPLAKKRSRLTLQQLAEYPMITYDSAFAGQTHVLKEFSQANLKPNIVITALDSDVIKTYVKLGIGVGLVAKMAYDPKADKGIKLIDVGHLFEPNTTWIGLRRGGYVRDYVYDFIERFAPHLKQKSIRASLSIE